MSSPHSHLTVGHYSDHGQRNDRSIDSQAVRCPSCQAEPGTACASSSGKRTHHASRRRMAIRALNETSTYTPVDLGWFASIKPEARRRLRRGTNLNDLAAEFGVSYDRLRRWENGSALPVGPAGAAYERWLRRALGQDAPEPAEVLSL